MRIRKTFSTCSSTWRAMNRIGVSGLRTDWRPFSPPNSDFFRRNCPGRALSSCLDGPTFRFAICRAVPKKSKLNIHVPWVTWSPLSGSQSRPAQPSKRVTELQSAFLNELAGHAKKSDLSDCARCSRDLRRFLQKVSADWISSNHLSPYRAAISSRTCARSSRCSSGTSPKSPGKCSRAMRS